MNPDFMNFLQQLYSQGGGQMPNMGQMYPQAQGLMNNAQTLMQGGYNDQIRSALQNAFQQRMQSSGLPGMVNQYRNMMGPPQAPQGNPGAMGPPTLASLYGHAREQFQGSPMGQWANQLRGNMQQFRDNMPSRPQVMPTIPGGQGMSGSNMARPFGGQGGFTPGNRGMGQRMMRPRNNQGGNQYPPNV